MKDYIYLDNNATTELDPLVFEVMEKEMKGPPCNPSANHFLGKKAKKRLLEAKESIASLLRVQPKELIFTSGGTESLNLLVRGAIIGRGKGHIITTDIEHSSVYKTILDLEKHGCPVTYLKTGAYGAVKLDQVKESIKDTTKLIVFSAVNSETGALTDIEAISELSNEKSISFVIDGVALLGKKRFTMPKGLTAMGFSSHKIHGPKGSGLVYISSSMSLGPILLGGPQENNLRAGTENLAGILGTAKAIELAYEKLDENIEKMANLRNFFEKQLSSQMEIIINGSGPRICNTSNISFVGIDAEDLLIKLDLNKILASHGSACQSNSSTLSRILLNMELGRERARSSIRFSISRMSTLQEMEKAAKVILEFAKK